MEAIVFSIERNLCTVQDIIRTGRPWNISLLTYYVGTHLVQDPVIYLLETNTAENLGTRVEGTAATGSAWLKLK